MDTLETMLKDGYQPNSLPRRVNFTGTVNGDHHSDTRTNYTAMMAALMLTHSLTLAQDDEAYGEQLAETIRQFRKQLGPWRFVQRAADPDPAQTHAA